MDELAEVYARSLFEVARDHGKLDELREQLGQFADALDSNRELAVFFFSPYFSTTEKQDGLDRMLDGADPGAVRQEVNHDVTTQLGGYARLGAVYLTAALPTITDAVYIDGWSEPDYAGAPVIQLDGSGAGSGADGLRITAGGTTIRGLVINRFSGDGIELNGSSGNTSKLAGTDKKETVPVK